MLTFFSQRSSRPSYTRRQPITRCLHKCSVSLFNCSRFCFFVSDLLTSICDYHLIHFFTRERSAESIPVTSICIRNVEDAGGAIFNGISWPCRSFKPPPPYKCFLSLIVTHVLYTRKTIFFFSILSSLTLFNCCNVAVALF